MPARRSAPFDPGVHFHYLSRKGGRSMPDWAIAGVIAIVVLFGATKLPEIARNLGRSSNEFKKGLKEGAVDEPAPQPAPAEAKTEDTKPAE
jgi:sec-independent protein translocase protein TatA